MVFTSLHYLFFLPFVVLLYYAVRPHWRWAFLLAASAYFYMVFIPQYILILCALICVDFVAALLIAESQQETRRRLLLIASVSATVLFLAFFKYLNMLAATWAALWPATAGTPAPHFDIILPIGLSFHTFQSLSYVFEVYYGRVPPQRHLGRYALYVLFFPQLVAGPIERPQNLMPQLEYDRPFSPTQATAGFRIILWGVFLKLMVADRLAPFVEEAYGRPAAFGGVALGLATLFFGFQIYCDFAGYSCIAVGSARLFGIELMRNFSAPYLASSINDFWRRWHISLSTWFRDYVYIPLGGNRAAPGRRYINLLVVFILSGIWHGAQWTFVFWGFLHGLFIIVADITRRAGLPVGPWSGRILTLTAVMFGWVFFRANSITEGFLITGRIVGALLQPEWLSIKKGIHSLTISLPELFIYLALIAIVVAADIAHRKGWITAWLESAPRFVRWATYYVLIGMILLFGQLHEKPFIYFQF